MRHPGAAGTALAPVMHDLSRGDGPDALPLFEAVDVAAPEGLDEGLTEAVTCWAHVRRHECRLGPCDIDGQFNDHIRHSVLRDNRSSALYFDDPGCEIPGRAGKRPVPVECVRVVTSTQQFLVTAVGGPAVAELDLANSGTVKNLPQHILTGVRCGLGSPGCCDLAGQTLRLRCCHDVASICHGQPVETISRYLPECRLISARRSPMSSPRPAISPAYPAQRVVGSAGGHSYLPDTIYQTPFCSLSILTRRAARVKRTTATVGP
jgi:hypothetical protein